MKYIKISPFVHLVIQKLDRKKLDMEVVFSAGGSFFEKTQHRGKKHLMEHCIASRTKKLNLKEFKNWQFCENILVNAYTTPKVLGLTTTSHKNQFQIALKALIEMAFDPTFDQEVLNQEKEIVLREISERSGDPEYKVYYNTMDNIFEEGSLDRHQTLGDYDLVKDTVLSDFEELHSQNVANSHILINLIGGGIDEDFAIDTINRFFAQENRFSKYLNDKDSKLPLDFSPENKLKSFEYQPVVNEHSHEHCNLSIFLPVEYDYQVQPVARLFDELFLRYYGKLHHVLRDELGYIYGLSSDFRISIQALELTMSCEKKYILPIIEVIKKVFSDFEANFDPQKFDQLQKVICLKVEISSDSIDAINHFINANMLNYATFIDLDEYQKRLSSVSIQDVHKLYNNIQKNLSKMQVVVVSKDKSIEEIVF